MRVMGRPFPLHFAPNDGCFRPSAAHPSWLIGVRSGFLPGRMRGPFRHASGSEVGIGMRQFLLLAAKVAITLSLLYFAFSRINLDVVAERWSRLDVSRATIWLLFAIAVAGAQLILISLRWQRIARQCGATLGGRSAFRFNLISTFFNQ